MPHPRRVRRAPRILALGLALAAALSLAAPAHADDSDVTWGIEPTGGGRSAFSYQVAPGSTVTDSVTISNGSAEDRTFRVYAADAVTDYQTGQFSLIAAGTCSTGLGAWTSVDGGPAACADAACAACAATLGVTVTVPAGAQAEVPFRIAVPEDATPGDHAAGIVASLASTGAADGTSVGRQVRIGSRVYLRVDGALAPGLSVSGTAAGWDPTAGLFLPGTATVGFDLKNIGNLRLSAQPTGTIAAFGIPLGTVAFDQVSDLVPGGVARVTGSVDGIPPLLLLFVDVTVDPIAADGGGDPLPTAPTGSAVAWAVPWGALLVLVAGALVTAAVLWWRRRSRARLAAGLAAYTERALARDRADRAEAEAEAAVYSSTGPGDARPARRAQPAGQDRAR